MNPSLRASVARSGLALGTVLFAASPLILCDCPGLFLCAAVAALAPAIWGVKLVRLGGILLCLAALAVGLGQLISGDDHGARLGETLKRIEAGPMRTNPPAAPAVPPR